MPGLQRRVLAVVDEREQLARLVIEVAFPGAQGPDDAGSDQRHRRAAALRRQLGQLGEIAASGLLVRGTAAQAEPERAGHVGRVGALVWPYLAARDVDVNSLWQQLLPGRIHYQAALRVVGQPGVRQPALDLNLLKRGWPRLVITDEEVAACLVPAAGIVVPARCIPAAVAGPAFRAARGVASGHY